MLQAQVEARAAAVEQVALRLVPGEAQGDALHARSRTHLVLLPPGEEDRRVSRELAAQALEALPHPGDLDALDGALLGKAVGPGRDVFRGRGDALLEPGAQGPHPAHQAPGCSPPSPGVRARVRHARGPAAGDEGRVGQASVPLQQRVQVAQLRLDLGQGVRVQGLQQRAASRVVRATQQPPAQAFRQGAALVLAGEGRSHRLLAQPGAELGLERLTRRISPAPAVELQVAEVQQDEDLVLRLEGGLQVSRNGLVDLGRGPRRALALRLRSVPGVEAAPQADRLEVSLRHRGDGPAAAVRELLGQGGHSGRHPRSSPLLDRAQTMLTHGDARQQGCEVAAHAPRPGVVGAPSGAAVSLPIDGVPVQSPARCRLHGPRPAGELLAVDRVEHAEHDRRRALLSDLSSTGRQEHERECDPPDHPPALSSACRAAS